MVEWDLINNYVDLMTYISDAPHEFFEASAIYLLSTVARKFVFLSTPDIEIFSDSLSGKKLNLWFCLIGKSRISRKSTVLSKAEEYIKYIDKNLLLPKDFTPESAIRDMSKKKKGDSVVCTWIHDEVSGFFQAVRKKDYMITTDTLLSRIYDGRDYEKETISRGREVIKDPYLTMLVSSTEYLPTIFIEDHLRQGFLNRFIFVVKLKRDKHMKLKQTVDEDIIKDLREIGDILKTIYNYDINIPILFSEDAKNVYDEYEEYIEDIIEKNELDIREGFYGNIPNLTQKLSSLFRISRLKPEDIYTYNKPFLMIEEEDVERAISYTKKCIKWFEEVIKIMKIKPERKRLLIDESGIEYIKTLLREHGGCMKKSDLLKLSKMSFTKFNEIINTLVLRDEIEVIEMKSGKSGRKPIFIKLRD